MGNSSHKPNDYNIVNTYRPENWIRQTEQNQIEIWTNKLTQEKAQVFILQQIPSLEDMNRYEKRNSAPFVVRILHIALNNNSLFCLNSQFAHLLVEYIPIRLSMLLQLDLEQALTTLHAAYKGFHTLTNLFGHSKPSQDLIGYNEQGKPKVWLNKQLNLNFSQTELKNQYYCEAEEVKNIFEMISKRIRGRGISEYVRRQLLDNNLSYLEAAEVIEQYAFREELSLRRYIRTDLIERQLGINRRFIRYKSESSLFLNERTSRATEVKGNPQDEQQSRIMVSKSLHFTHKNTQLSYQPQSRLTIMSNKPSVKVAFSPTSQNYKSIPKITFNSQPYNPPVTPLLINDQNHLATMTNTLESQQLNLSLLKSPPPPKLQKMSANQIQFRVPRILFSKTSSGQNKKNLVSTCNQNSLPQKNKPVTPEKTKTKTTEEPQKVQALQANIEQMVAQNNYKKNEETLSEKISEKYGTGSQHTIIDKIINQIQLTPSDTHTPQPQTNTPKPAASTNSLNENIQYSAVFQDLNNALNAPQQQDIPKPPIYELPSDEEMSNEQSFKKDYQRQPIKEVPINFESFGVNLFPNAQNYSFAPKIHQPVDPNPNLQVQSSQSLQFEEHENISNQKSNKRSNSGVKFVQSGEQLGFDQTDTHEDKQEQFVSNLNYGQYNTNSREQSHCSSESDDSVSIKKFQPPLAPSDFYQQYTPVESKFQIVLKKQSSPDLTDNQHPNRISAFAQIQDQDQLKAELQNIFPQARLRVNRVDSQYEMLQQKKSDPPTKRFFKKQPHQAIKSNQNIKQQQDFLDVKFLQKSLDLKYKSHIKKQPVAEEDQLNIAKLDEKLEHFSASKCSISKDPEEKVKNQQENDKKETQNLSQLQLHSEINKIKPMPSIEERYPHQNDQKTKENTEEHSSKALNSSDNKWKTQDSEIYQQFKKIKDNKLLHQLGFSTLQEGEFSNPTRYYQSVERSSFNKHKTYGYDQNWRTNAQTKPNKQLTKSQSNKLLEQRYQKYVKKPRQLNKKQSEDYFSRDKYSNTQSSQRNQRLSAHTSPFRIQKEDQSLPNRANYNQVRSILWN